MQLLPWLIVALACAAPPAAFAADRSFQLTREGDLYTLRAEGARLADILAELDAWEPAELRFYSPPARTVRGEYRDLPLEKLLERLDVKFALTYTPGTDGRMALDDARLLDRTAAIAPPAYPELTQDEIALVRKAIADLRDDDLVYNAIEAQDALYPLGCGAAPYLEAALDSSDPQQRYSAASILARFCDEYVPSDRFLAVQIEQLDSRHYNEDLKWLARPSTAFNSLWMSPNLVPRVAASLQNLLDSEDPQARLMSALLLAGAGRTDLASRLVPLLVPHLADNDLQSDASLAMHALYRLGAAVRPYLEQAQRNPLDDQQEEAADLLLYQIENPDSDDAFMTKDFNTPTPNPARERPFMSGTWWEPWLFPDEHGRYPRHEEGPE